MITVKHQLTCATVLFDVMNRFTRKNVFNWHLSLM